MTGRNRRSRRRRRRIRGRRVERQSYRQHRSTTVKRPASTAYACTCRLERACMCVCVYCLFTGARGVYVCACAFVSTRELLCVVQLVITLLIVRHSRRGRNARKNVTHGDDDVVASQSGRTGSARWLDATDGHRALVACGTYSWRVIGAPCVSSARQTRIARQADSVP